MAFDKKAEDICILDMRKVVNFCDYFVVASGIADRQVQAIADGISEGLRKIGINVRYKEGFHSSTWILLDLGDVVVHIFEAEVREFYGLEHLWQDASRVNWQKKSKSFSKFLKT